jgi:hypothetical protein
MDKCFACPNKAEYILPCYHKVCDICLHDMINGVCLHYPDETCDKQCLTSFKQDEVLLITDNNNNIFIDVCSIHNEEYIFICDCDAMFCNKCNLMHHHCNKIQYLNPLVLPSVLMHIHDIKYFKPSILTQMENFKRKLLNKINGLECIIELIEYDDKSSSSIKQIEDIIDTIYVDISHINNFIQLINDVSLSQIINRKNKILNSNINIQTLSIDKKLNFIEFINIIINNDGDINSRHQK